MTQKFQQCLRPEFTERLLNDLTENSFTVNIWGLSKEEQKRLASDLKQCRLLTTQIIEVNMKAFRTNHLDFFKAIATAAQWKLKTKDPTREVLEKLRKTPQNTILIIHDFCTGLRHQETDSYYDQEFLGHLNAITKNSDLGILLFTDRRAVLSGYYLKSKFVNMSVLDISWDEKIRPLSTAQIDRELCRINPSFSENVSQRTLCRQYSASVADSLGFMKYVKNELTRNYAAHPFDLKFEQKLKKYRRDFLREHRTTFDKSIYSLRQWEIKQRVRLDNLLGVTEEGKKSAQSVRKIILNVILIIASLTGTYFIFKNWLIALFR